MARILYFTRDYTTHDRRFLSALAQTEHRVYYLRLEHRGHTLEDRPLPPEIQVVAWEGGQRPFQLRDGVRLLAGLRRVIRMLKPDLVHAGPLQTCGLLAALTGFHPLVSMSWGYDLLIDAVRNPFYRWATRFTLRRSDVMVGDCATIRQQAVAFGMPDDSIVTFPWGIDLDHFKPQDGRRIFGFADLSTIDDEPQNEPRDHGPRDDGGRELDFDRSRRPAAGGQSASAPFTLLSTRGWEPIYGVDIIARAFVIAAQKAGAAQEAGSRGLPQLRLIMLGNGSQAGMLRQVFREGGVLDQVIFPGQVSYADLPRYYHSTDLYLSASHSDGTSISLLEGMACGRPALVSDIPGNREWVTPGENGWWFPDGDAGALAEAILEAAAQRSRLTEMGRAARCTAEQRADWEKNFPHLLRAYRLAERISS